jgi:aminoglycoside phosphotransferase (APT) family kinase protein
MQTPPAEVEVDEDVVRALLADQHPDLASLPLRALASGFDNVLFRLGDELLVRIPRRAVASRLLGHEVRWLPGLAPHLPLPVPTPVRVGEPAHGVPWAWSIVPWLEGTPADLDPPRADQATVWAELLRALHRPAPADAPHNPLRGVPLADRRAGIEARLSRLAVEPGVRSAWDRALRARPAHQRRWIHGDPHPRNILVRRGRFVAVIDWGDLTAGDVATDLASAWMLFGERIARETVLQHYGADPAQVDRARGWAVAFGALLAVLDDTPYHRAVGLQTLARVVEGP